MAETLYDEVPYPSAVYSQTHPDRLAMHAALLGISSAPVEKCRVLELGCGDGWNLIAMAHALPGSEFAGIDLAEKPVARGTALAAQLGLRNLSLRAMDVADAAGLGKFDYIIAHGLYSWVPQPVREKVMALCGHSLAESGVAYVSYNAYPGNHARDLVRGMMRYHTAHFAEPQQKIRQARGVVKFLAESKEPREPYHEMLAQQLERIGKYTDAAFFHDDLSSVNQPFYFHEFMAEARRCGLQYLAEADVADNRREEFSPQVEAVLAGLDPADIVAREQYLDFLKCRAFRQTLLCRAGARLARDIAPGRVRVLHVAGEIRAAKEKPELHSRTAEIFHGPKNSEIETDRPLVKAALARLGAEWPQCVRFSDLLAHSAAELGAVATAQDAEDLAVALAQAHEAGFAEFRTHRARFTTRPGARPRASALARLQLALGDRVTTLLHSVVQIRDPLGCELLRLADGTRDRASLRAGLASLPAAGGVTVTEQALDENLRRLARLALLEE